MRENVGIFHQELEGVQRLVQWQPGSLLSNKSQSWTDPTNIHHGTSRSTRQMETIPLWPWDHHDCFSGFHLQQLSPSFSSLWCLQEASHPIYLVGLKEETGKTPLALPSITSKYFFSCVLDSSAAISILVLTVYTGLWIADPILSGSSLCPLPCMKTNKQKTR